MTWRPHLPDDCPPEDAKNTEGFFYRLINGNEPEPNDFLSHREMGNRKKPDWISECEFCSVSVFSELGGILNLLELYPKFRITKHLAKVDLGKSHGKIKHTPSKTHISHHSWWIPIEVEPSYEATVIEFPPEEN